MKKIFKNVTLYLIIQGIAFVVIGIPLVFKGPFVNIKENWVLTAMTTMTHQYLATWFVDQDEIDRIIEKNKTPDSTEIINLGAIKISKNSINQELNVYDTFSYPGSEVIYNEDGVKVETFKGSKFKAYVTIIDDPSRVQIATTDRLGSYGEKLESITERYNAVIGINAGGFVDDNGQGTGGVPLGIVIEDGEEIFAQSNQKYHIVGFNEEDILVLGEHTKAERDELNLRDAITFRPFLIVNGKPQITEGNGGWGIAPRTAIGQRKDGKVILLTIDGRQTTSIGATLKEVQDIMLLYGAYNCANLDGGSSTQLVLNGDTINSPSSVYGPRNLSTAFIVK